MYFGDTGNAAQAAKAVDPAHQFPGTARYLSEPRGSRKTKLRNGSATSRSSAKQQEFLTVYIDFFFFWYGDPLAFSCALSSPDKDMYIIHIDYGATTEEGCSTLSTRQVPSPAGIAFESLDDLVKDGTMGFDWARG
jgi:hypothetical protein